jgi:sulfur transfer complex TusBCD TusB component (DsrH family)
VRWSVPITPRIPDDLGDPSELLVAGGVVYFSSDGVYELDATDRTVIAHYLTGEGVDAVLLLVGDTVYASASGSAQSSFAEHTYAAVFAVARQGSARTLRGQVKLPSGSVGQIVPTAQAVYVASWGDGIYAPVSPTVRSAGSSMQARTALRIPRLVPRRRGSGHARRACSRAGGGWSRRGPKSSDYRRVVLSADSPAASW